MKTRKIKYTATVCRWFDKVNGNTYHSVRVTRHKDGKVIACGWRYGYGEQYKQTAMSAMIKAGWIRGYTDQNVYGKFERERNYPILWNVSDGLKRDMVANGTL